MNHFATSLHEGASNVKTSINQGLQTYMLVEAIQRAAKTRQVVSVKQIKAEIWGDQTPRD